MNHLSLLFEEDIAMQDSIEDIQTLTDDAEDMVIDTLENHKDPEEGKIHLFANPIEHVNDDGLTPDEELEYNLAVLRSDEYEDDDGYDDEDEIEDVDTATLF